VFGVFSGQSVFSQFLSVVHPQQFRRCVERYRGEYKVRSFSCWDHFLCMAFAQLTFRESLRDLEECLASKTEQLYHLGFRSRVCRSTLAEANEHRDWRIYADLAAVLMRKARRLYATDSLATELEQTVYAFDSTTIDLSLGLFPWANFRYGHSAVKIHTLLDLRGPIPSFLEITPAACHDVNALDWLLVEPGAFYVMDRGYVDYARLYQLHQASAYFVVRAKDGLNFIRHRSQPVDRASGLRSDHLGRFRGYYSHQRYPERLRVIHFFDAEQERHLRFLTNHLHLPALTVCQLYKMRWQVELFFKWIKQHLRIKRFFGTTLNAVKTQVWIAVVVYLLVAIWKKELNLPQSLHSILQVLSISPFEKVSLRELLTKASSQNAPPHLDNQLTLNGI
jgi:hypothetical protein